jgi:excisionase family DNA binding protein
MTNLGSDELLTIDQVASLLQVNPQTVRNWIDAGKLPALRIGARRIRVQRGELNAFTGFRSALGGGDGSPDLSSIMNARNSRDAANALDQIAAGLTALAATLRDNGQADRPQPKP